MVFAPIISLDHAHHCRSLGQCLESVRLSWTENTVFYTESTIALSTFRCKVKPNGLYSHEDFLKNRQVK